MKFFTKSAFLPNSLCLEGILTRKIIARAAEEAGIKEPKNFSRQTACG